MAQPYELSLADTAFSLAEAAGLRLQDWQRDMLKDWAACDGAGQFVHRRCLASIPRQAGKSTVAIAWVIALVLNGYHVLWTCHNYSTTCEMRKRIARVFGSRRADPRAERPEFNAYVSAANNKTGQEALEFTTGGVLEFSTRTASATLGYSFDVVIYDEAQELTDEQQQVIFPTTTSGPKLNPQSVYTGTPLRPGRPGTVFARDRRAILDGTDPSSDYCLWEWGVDEVGDVRDESRWAAVNPSIGRIACVDAIRMALPPDMTETAFAQEYLGYWLPTGTAEVAAIGEAAWAALAVDNPPTDGKAVLAFKFGPDGARGAVVACRRRKGGTPHVEAIAYRSMAAGLGWFEEFAKGRVGRYAGFVIDGGGNAQELNDRLLAAKVPKRAISRPGSGDVSAACAGFLADIADGSLTHFGQPGLDAAVAHCKKRAIGKTGFGFEGFGGHDALLVECAALALWGIDSIKRDPTRKMRVG